MRQSTSMFIGYTTGGIAQPVLFDTHTQIFNNKPPTTLVTGAPGSGKDLDIETPIPTPSGFTRMGDIKLGDRVLSREFKPCRVTYVGEIKARDSFCVALSDGREIIAGREHQWVVTTGDPEDIAQGASLPRQNSRRKFFSEMSKSIEVLQKTAGMRTVSQHWFTPEQIRKLISTVGVTWWLNAEEIESVLVRYQVAHSVLPMSEDPLDTTVQTQQTYNVFMSLQSLKEELHELSILSYFEEKVVTTEEAIALIDSGKRVRLRSVVPVNGEDRNDTGYINDEGVVVGAHYGGERTDNADSVNSVNSADNADSVNSVGDTNDTGNANTAGNANAVDSGSSARIDFTDVAEGEEINGTDVSSVFLYAPDSREFGSVKERRIELRRVVANSVACGDIVAGEREFADGGMTSIARVPRKIAKRIVLLVRSLGGRVEDRDGETFAEISVAISRPDSSVMNRSRWVEVTSITWAGRRQTRCISVDSHDHAYLAGEGFIPTHNTFFAMTITCLSAVLGKTTVVLDPKGDFLSLHELQGDIGSVTFWNLKDKNKAGILDPFYLAKDKGEKLNLVLETISLFLGGLTSENLQVLSPIVKDIMEVEAPSMRVLMEEMSMSPRPAAREIGTQLDLISRLPFANLCFSQEHKRRRDISIDDGVTVVTMAGLELNPDAGKGGKESNKSKLSSAIFFLITDFIRRFMHDSQDTKPKTIIIDEAWAVLATDEGSRVIKEIALLARSKNLALVLVTQNVSHLGKIDVENTISSRFAFRTDASEGESIVHNMGLPEGEGFEKVLTGLGPGECLMQDFKHRFSTVQISQYNTRWKESFETNPLEKMKAKRRKEEEKRRKREQVKAMHSS